METGQVEFKETTGQLERGMETLCCLSERYGWNSTVWRER